MSTQSLSTNRRLPICRLVLIAVVLPAAIATTDYILFYQVTVPGLSDYYASLVRLNICSQFTWYVVQIGIVGYVVGRGIADRFWRWLVFGWILALVTILTVTEALSANGNPGSSLPVAGLFAGAIGFCLTWAFFGSNRWQVRWPSMAFAGASIYLFWYWLIIGNYLGEIWAELLLLHLIMLSLFCAIFKLRGFRLLNAESIAARSHDESSDRRVLQFSLKHMLIWATALAILLGIAKSLDLLTLNSMQKFVSAGLIWKLSLATSSGISVVVALWVALGRERWFVRYLVGILIGVSLGTAIGAWGRYEANWINQNWVLVHIDRQLLESYAFGWWWLGWIFLSGGLLASTLIILRTLGYRLVRIQRGLRQPTPPTWFSE